MAFAFVHVRLAPWSRESLRTIASKRTRRVHTDSVMLTRRTLIALVNILRAVDTLVTGCTRACERSIYRTRVTDSVRMTRIRRARIVQMA